MRVKSFINPIFALTITCLFVYIFDMFDTSCVKGENVCVFLCLACYMMWEQNSSEELTSVLNLFFAIGLINFTGQIISYKNETTFFLINALIHGLIGQYVKSSWVCTASIMFLILVCHTGLKKNGVEKMSISLFMSIITILIGSILKTRNTKNANIWAQGMLGLGTGILCCDMMIIRSNRYCKKMDYNYFFCNLVIGSLYVGGMFLGERCNILSVNLLCRIFCMIWLMNQVNYYYYE